MQGNTKRSADITRIKEQDMTATLRTKMEKIAYGGDWNPEQWDKETMREDIERFKMAGIDMLTINVFSWTICQPEESRYSFDWLDDIISALKTADMKVCLATATAAHPAWMARKYPDILRIDFEGRKRTFGDRHNSCPSSLSYRRFAPALAGRLAARYKDEPTVRAWHVSNEMMGACYCDNCAASFRKWLAARYGSLEALNEAWNTRFWNQYFTDWEEIWPPSPKNVQWGYNDTAVQGWALDYARFNSDNLLECFILERDAIKKHIPEALVTTNFMGAYRPVNYRKWAKALDFVSWDSYPKLDEDPAHTAFMHDLMRGLKNGAPFWLMEQTPSQTNWADYNSLKRPGVMALQSWQAVAHGADSVMFFQMRRSRGGCEKFHGAVIEHHNRVESRVFREVSRLGAQLKKLGPESLGKPVEASVALWFDWESWWAIEMSMGPHRELNYCDEIISWYKAMHRLGVGVDVVGPDTDLSGYKILLAPYLYMLHQGIAERLEKFVQNGGQFLTTFLSGVSDESDLVFKGGAPGPLKSLTGIWSEEIDSLPPSRSNKVVLEPEFRQNMGLKESYSCSGIFDLIGIDVDGVEQLGFYEKEFYRGRSALLKRNMGTGSSWYVASLMEQEFKNDFMDALCSRHSVPRPLNQVPDQVEVSLRKGREENSEILFILNYSDKAVTIDISQYETLQDLMTQKSLKGSVLLESKSSLIASVKKI